MEAPSLVMVGAPPFCSSTTLRPLGPSVTLTASARMFIPRSSPRRASSSNAIILAIRRCPPGHSRRITRGDATARLRTHNPQCRVASRLVLGRAPPAGPDKARDDLAHDQPCDHEAGTGPRPFVLLVLHF